MVKLPEGEDENEWLAVNSTPNPESCEPAVYTSAQMHMLIYDGSGGLLQPDQPPLWRHHRVLLSSIVSGDEGDRRVGLENLGVWLPG